MITILPRLAGILSNLRTLHENDNTPCPGPSNCPLLAIMGDVEGLMDDIAKDQGADVASKVEECRPQEPQPPMAPKDEMIFNAWLELHHVLEWEVPNPGMEWWGAARPMLVKSDAILTQLITGIENLPPIAYMPIDPDPEFQAADLLPEDAAPEIANAVAVADAIIRAQSNPAAKFLPATSLCIICDRALPESHAGNVCPQCVT